MQRDQNQCILTLGIQHKKALPEISAERSLFYHG